MTPFLPSTIEVCEGYVFTGVCLSTGRACVAGWGHALQEGVHGRGACVAGGYAWQGGECVAHTHPPADTTKYGQ